MNDLLEIRFLHVYTFDFSLLIHHPEHIHRFPFLPIALDHQTVVSAFQYFEGSFPLRWKQQHSLVGHFHHRRQTDAVSQPLDRPVIANLRMDDDNDSLAELLNVVHVVGRQQNRFAELAIERFQKAAYVPFRNLVQFHHF
jgi:hypothetical protein